VAIWLVRLVLSKPLRLIVADLPLRRSLKVEDLLKDLPRVAVLEALGVVSAPFGPVSVL
jgi:hypothetical protein